MGVTAPAATSPAASTRSAPAARPRPEGDAAKRFGESLGRHAAGAQGDGAGADTPQRAVKVGLHPPRKSVPPGDTGGQGVAADLPVPRRVRDEHPAALADGTPTKAVAAAPAERAPPSGTPAQPAIEVAVADRLGLPEPRGGETRVSFPDAQAPARDVLVVQDAGGGVSIDITLRDDRPRDTAVTDELRRRLAARGILVAQVAAH
ncbi:hypothetical protein [Sphingomonas sp. NFR15]|uniref:hypothetical protein n=1 Tax=Sphingomonas sp. NFR15 TaxID=1566282 RepID=UPI00088853B5|nr:hypothetical protein [Sphingomonas sp. NFR15]SDA36264.1 hypothetical protein SAMN03159340_03593 [Sphingomonas sp. NFR15]